MMPINDTQKSLLSRNTKRGISVDFVVVNEGWFPMDICVFVGGFTHLRLVLGEEQFGGGPTRRFNKDN